MRISQNSCFSSFFGSQHFALCLIALFQSNETKPEFWSLKHTGRTWMYNETSLKLENARTQPRVLTRGHIKKDGAVATDWPDYNMLRQMFIKQTPDYRSTDISDGELDLETAK